MKKALIIIRQYPAMDISDEDFKIITEDPGIKIEKAGEPLQVTAKKVVEIEGKQVVIVKCK